MAKIKLTQLLLTLSMIEFEFGKPQVTKTKEGETVVVLPLITPIERVMGSQRVADDSGALHTVFADDVMEVRVHQRDFEDSDDFEWDEENEVGRYKGSDLMWDVAKRSQDAWLVSTSFASMGNAMRSENQRLSFSKYLPAGSAKKDEKKGKPELVSTGE